MNYNLYVLDPFLSGTDSILFVRHRAIYDADYYQDYHPGDDADNIKHLRIPRVPARILFISWKIRANSVT